MTQRSSRYVEQWGVVTVIARMWLWLWLWLVALLALGAGLGALLIPVAFFWLVFGGG